MSSRKKRN